MKVMALFMVVSFLVFASQSHAQDPMRGANLYNNSCVSCHGQNAEGNAAQKAPRLGGQYDWYLVTSLTDFKKGARKHPQMKSLTEQDMKDLAAHISRLK